MKYKHFFIASELYKDYEICYECGTYHSIAQVDPKLLYEGDYWSHENGRSTLEEQVYNVTETESCGISKVDKVLQFVPKDANKVLEIGCAPGILLKKLSDLKYNAFGIEPNEKYIPFIESQCGRNATVMHGYFPNMVSPDWFLKSISFDCIIGMDILEHIDNYNVFVRAIYERLSEGGTAIFMVPVICEDGLYRERDMKADEHCWIFTKKFLQPYLENIFSEVIFDRWVVGHDIIVCKK